MEEQYQDCYVAFLDILGFKELLDKDDFNQVFNIFNAIKQFEIMPAIEMDAYKEIKIHIMSYSIIVFVNAEVINGFVALTDICGKIQMYLLEQDKPILLRGGIAKGTLYCKDDIIFGSGLSRAYILENNLAEYPRIIFTEETRQNGLKNAELGKLFDIHKAFYVKDEDELYYVNFFDLFFFNKYSCQKSVEESIKYDNDYFDKLIAFVDDKLSYLVNQSLRKKYIWLKRKIYEAVEIRPNVKEHIQEIEKKKYEQEQKELSRILNTHRANGIIKKGDNNV